MFIFTCPLYNVQIKLMGKIVTLNAYHFFVVKHSKSSLVVILNYTMYSWYYFQAICYAIDD